MRSTAVFLLLLTVSVFLVLLTSNTEASPLWGPVGHQLTATIAQYFLSDAAATQVLHLFPNVSGQLEAYATWADAVRKEPAYAWSAPLHFIDTPDWACIYDPSTDCPTISGSPHMCVAGAILNYTSILLSQKSTQQKIEALKFLLHFIGDIHQPLHVSFASDLGGNTIKGTYEGTSTNLHSVWDIDLITTRVENDFGGDANKYCQYLQDKIKGDWKTIAATWEACNSTSGATVYSCPTEWANESAKLACEYGYTDENGKKIQSGFNLGSAYFNFVKDIVDEQLARGGVRLAATLNKIFA